MCICVFIQNLMHPVIIIPFIYLSLKPIIGIAQLNGWKVRVVHESVPIRKKRCMMKNSLCIMVSLFLGICSYAQAQEEDEFEKYFRERTREFDSYTQEKESDFEKYRAELNARFAAYLKERWEEVEVLAGEKPPLRPEPDKPVVFDDKRPAAPVRLPLSDIPTLPASPQPLPREVPKIKVPEPGDYRFSFYDTPCRVHLDANHRYRLTDVSEEAVSAAWNRLSRQDYSAVLADCFNLRRDLKLGDWAYVDLLGKLSSSFFGQTNEAVLFQAYLLAQSGYDVRVVRTGHSLLLAFTADNPVYQLTYLIIEKKRYYLTGSPKAGATYFTFRKSFSNHNTPCSLKMREAPSLAYAPLQDRTLASVRYPQLSVNVRPNKNLIDFYNHYPLCDWNIYAATPLSPQLKQAVLPVLGKQIAGKTEAQAANMLINFVQTAFEYQTDEEQFGYERPFFPDETFAYPYSDCEDRAILFSNLVRELLKLEVVLLHYPSHLATAVRFNEEVEGDYVVMEGKKYVVCDPTFIGASIGRTMPEYKNVQAEVVREKN